MVWEHCALTSRQLRGGVPAARETVRCRRRAAIPAAAGPGQLTNHRQLRQLAARPELGAGLGPSARPGPGPSSPPGAALPACPDTCAGQTAAHLGGRLQ